jgi:hypothetical protein
LNTPKQRRYFKIGEESDLSLEVVILLIYGVFMLLFGIVLIKIYSGEFPYTADSTYGLFLVLVSFQIITMGKTPFGDLRRSWFLILLGIATAVIGMISCFTPGLITEIVRVLVGIMLFFGGISLLVQLFHSKDKAKNWMKNRGILKHLTIACAVVYVLTIILGVITLIPGIITYPEVVILIIYGISIFYLAYCIQKVARLYSPPEIRNPAQEMGSLHSSKKPSNFFQEASLPLTSALMIMMGVLITLLGFLLLLVSQAILPFSPDGELGLLLVIMAIQLMALGQTPIGQYKRSWLLVIIGLIFAACGIFSCIVPGILTIEIYLLIGISNILGGIILLTKMYYPLIRDIRNPPEEVEKIPSIFKKLLITQTFLYLATIMFGVSMLILGLIPVIVIAGILVINGLLFFVAVSFIQKIPMET